MSALIPKPDDKSGRTIGIDLGTSNSAAAVIMGGKPKMIPMNISSAKESGMPSKILPSVVALSDSGELLVGELARRQAITNSSNTVIAAKREMGTDNTFVMLGKKYKPEEISAFILEKIKKDAELYLGEQVKKAVITVPAYFDDNQRRATRDAGIMAGLDVAKIINEPTAASLAFGFNGSDNVKTLVFDLGGGTLDVTVMDMSNGVFEVMSTSGDTKLGGVDMDEILIDYVIDEFKKRGVDLTQDIKAMAKIRMTTENAKIDLSTVTDVVVDLSLMAQNMSTNTNKLEVIITRAKLEELIMPIVEKCKSPILTALSDAALDPDDIDKIVMVGGPTMIPLVRKFVGDMLGKSPESGVDPMETVATGAAIQAGILDGNTDTDLVLLDVTPLSLGVDVMGGLVVPLIKKNTTIPASATKTFITTSDNQTEIKFHIVQGERPMYHDNVQLDEVTIKNIPEAPRGVQQVVVTFDIDANGLLTIEAKSIETQEKTELKIEASRLLSSDVEKLKTDAADFFEEDKTKKGKVELFVEVDGYIYNVRNKINSDSIPQEQKIKIINAINETESVLMMDPAVLKPKFESLKSMVDEINHA